MEESGLEPAEGRPLDIRLDTRGSSEDEALERSVSADFGSVLPGLPQKGSFVSSRWEAAFNQGNIMSFI